MKHINLKQRGWGWGVGGDQKYYCACSNADDVDPQKHIIFSNQQQRSFSQVKMVTDFKFKRTYLISMQQYSVQSLLLSPVRSSPLRPS